jgi:hypothetical protein
MSAQSFDPIADLRTAVEQIKREPKPHPDMVPWDEYMSHMKNSSHGEAATGRATIF